MKTKSYASFLLLTSIFWLLSFTPASSQQIRKHNATMPEETNPIREITKNQQILHSLLTQPMAGSSILTNIADLKPAKMTAGLVYHPINQASILGERLYKADTVISNSIGDGTMKQLCTYNDFGEVTSLINLQWTGSTWVNYDQQLKTYDYYGNMLTDLYQIWDNGNWLNSDLITFTYNSEGKILTQISKYWETNAWTNLAFDILTYDGSGNMLTAQEQVWDVSAWVNYTLETATYDANGRILTDLQQNWESSAWTNSMQYIYYYDPSGLSKTITRKAWDNSAWINQSFETYTYDANGNNTNYLVQLWDLTSWQNSYKLSCTYNFSGKILTMLEQTWESGNWLNNKYFTYTYSANGNLLTSLCQIWNGAWENYSLVAYSFLNNNWDNIHYQSWTGTTWQDYQVVEYVYTPGQILANASSWNGTAWEIRDWLMTVAIFNNGVQQSMYVGYNYQSQVYYSSMITGIADPGAEKKELMVVSPNPAHGMMNIVTQLSHSDRVSMELYDLSGRLVSIIYEGRVPADKNTIRVNVAEINPGFYMLKMRTTDSFEQQKVCIIK
jgi:hypothetical protein